MANESLQPGNLPVTVIEKWLDNQSKEIETKQRDIELRKQTDDHNFEYAKFALNAQVDDSKDERGHGSKNNLGS